MRAEIRADLCFFRKIRQLAHYMAICEELCYNLSIERFYKLGMML